MSGGDRDALTASTEHIGDELLGHGEIKAIFPILTEQ
jgi:hypothetical protein